MANLVVANPILLQGNSRQFLKESKIMEANRQLQIDYFPHLRFPCFPILDENGNTKSKLSERSNQLRIDDGDHHICIFQLRFR